MVFVSPAHRAAETAAWFLRGAGQQLPDHEVVPGLGGRDATGGSPEGMAAGVRALLDRVAGRRPGPGDQPHPLGRARRARAHGRHRRPAPRMRGHPGVVRRRCDRHRSELRLDGGIVGRVSWTSHIGAAFALGFALGAAPGPVQLLLLTETTKRGFSGGLRVMLGANGTLFLVMVALAFGFSSLAPGESLLRSAPRRGRRVLDLPGRRRAAPASVARRSTPTPPSRRPAHRWARRCAASSP